MPKQAVHVPAIHKLRPLEPGATIGIVSPGGPSSKDRFHAGIRELERRGFKARTPLDPTEFYGRYDHGFASGSIEARRQSFMELVRDPDVKLLLSVRGAYGSLDILPLLDFREIAAGGKTLVALSDICALLVNFVARAGIPAVHGPSLASAFADSESSAEAQESVDALFRLLQDPSYRPAYSLRVLRDGAGKGRIIAANLTMLQCLLGTPFDIDYEGAILVLEEVGESPYRIHRAFTQLKLAGKLEKLSGLVFGRFSRCAAEHGPTVEEVFALVIRDLLSGTSFPVLTGMEMGHWGKNLPLPLGCLAEISGESFRLLESPLVTV